MSQQIKELDFDIRHLESQNKRFKPRYKVR